MRGNYSDDFCHPTSRVCLLFTHATMACHIAELPNFLFYLPYLSFLSIPCLLTFWLSLMVNHPWSYWFFLFIISLNKSNPNDTHIIYSCKIITITTRFQTAIKNVHTIKWSYIYSIAFSISYTRCFSQSFIYLFIFIGRLHTSTGFWTHNLIHHLFL
jgi:hypothetical protein